METHSIEAIVKESSDASLQNVIPCRSEENAPGSGLLTRCADLIPGLELENFCPGLDSLRTDIVAQAAKNPCWLELTSDS